MLNWYLNMYRNSVTGRLIARLTAFIMALWFGSFLRRALYGDLKFEKRLQLQSTLVPLVEGSFICRLIDRILRALIPPVARVYNNSFICKWAGGFFGAEKLDEKPKELNFTYALVFVTAACVTVLPTKFILALCVLCVLLFGIMFLLGKVSVKLDTLDFFVILFAVVMGYSTIISYFPMDSAIMSATYILFILFYFVVKNTVNTKAKLFGIISAILVSGLVVSLFGIIQRETGWGFIATEAWLDEEMFAGSASRIYSTLDNPNVLGEYLIFTTMFSFAGLYYFKKWQYKLVALAMLGTSGLCMVFTLSRGAWLGLIFAVAVFALIKDRRLIWLGIIALFLLPFVLPPSILERFTSIGNLQDSSSSYRLNIWLASLEIIKDYWIIGIGMGTKVFSFIYQKFAFSASYAQHSHNLFLQMMIDMGISGLLLFVSIIFLFLKSYLSGLKHLKPKTNSFYTTAGAALCAGMCGYLLQGMTDNVWYNYRIVAFFWLAIALAPTFLNLMKKEGKQNENNKNNKKV